jgi:4-hydroxy-2-oxovalerate/4-hydroxy-2-oxohexanoate aldolase
MRELQSAYDCGARSVHVATHCTEADTAPQHIAFARKLGMDTTGFLMMAHLNDPEGIAQQGKLMESYGAHTVYVTDSAGYMLPDDVKARSPPCAPCSSPKPGSASTATTTWAWASANSIAAIEAGATRIDGSVAGLGAGAGNTPLEVFAAVCERMGIETGVDLFKLMDVAEELIVPMMEHVVRVDRESLTLGFAGRVLHLPAARQAAATRFGVPARDILVELGRKKMIGGQEDMIMDTAMTMAKERGLLKAVVRLEGVGMTILARTRTRRRRRCHRRLRQAHRRAARRRRPWRGGRGTPRRFPGRALSQRVPGLMPARPTSPATTSSHRGDCRRGRPAGAHGGAWAGRGGGRRHPVGAHRVDGRCGQHQGRWPAAAGARGGRTAAAAQSRIVAIAGHYGLEPTAYAAAAGVANAALLNVMRQLSLAYGPRGVTAHLIAPARPTPSVCTASRRPCGRLQRQHSPRRCWPPCAPTPPSAASPRQSRWPGR